MTTRPGRGSFLACCLVSRTDCSSTRRRRPRAMHPQRPSHQGGEADRMALRSTRQLKNGSRLIQGLRASGSGAVMRQQWQKSTDGYDLRYFYVITGTHMMLPFSENWPATVDFAVFQSYPQVIQKFHNKAKNIHKGTTSRCFLSASIVCLPNFYVICRHF